MARPTKFDPRIGRLIVAHVAVGATRDEAAERAGVSLRAVQYWLARGRRGEDPFATFAKHLDRAATDASRVKVAARHEREREADKGRWQGYKAAQERWWLACLGPVAFWSRRLAWCQDNGRDRGAARAREELMAIFEADGDGHAGA